MKRVELLTYRRTWALPLEVCWTGYSLHIQVLCFELVLRRRSDP